MNKRKEAVRGIKFALFSVSAGIIELASFALLEVFTPWPYWPNYLIALVLSVLWNFTLNRRFTFRASGNVPIAMLKVACFYIVFTPLSTILGNFLAENCGWDTLHKEGVPPIFENSGFMLFSFVVVFLPYVVGSLLPNLPV